MNPKIRKQIRDLYDAHHESGMGENNANLWLAMYRGECPWIVPEEVVSLNLPCTIASELARLATLEMEVNCDDKDMAEHIEPVVDEARKFTEYGLALGDIILKPYPVGTDGIAVDYVTPDMFIPISFDSFGRISRVVFLDFAAKTEVKMGAKIRKFYTRLEEHQITPTGYVIKNTAFVSDSVYSLGNKAELTAIEDWKDLAKMVTAPNVTYPLFGHFKNPQANNLDLKSPLGISCFSKAASLIQDADEQYSRILWEYTGSELAIDADVTALIKTGTLPKHGERLFRNIGLSGAPNQLYQVFSPQIRDQSLFNGLNQILRRIEYVCDLAYGTISDPNNVDKTAEEIRSSKQRSFATVVDIQKSLEKAFRELVRAMYAWTFVRNTKLPDLKVPPIGFNWDDSLVIDNVKEQQIRLQEVAAGISTPESYRMWRYGESEMDARDNLPDVAPEDHEDDGQE